MERCQASGAELRALLKRKAYREAIVCVARLLRAGVTELPAEGEKEDALVLEDVLTDLLQAYVDQLERESRTAIEQMRARVEQHPEHVLEEVAQWQQRLNDDLLPPWRRPRDRLSELEQIAQEARKWHQRQQEAEKWLQMARQTSVPWLQWGYIVKALEIYPHLPVEIQLQKEEAYHRWLQLLLQYRFKIEKLTRIERFSRAFEMLNRALQARPEDIPFSDLPSRIQNLLSEFQAQKTDIQDKMRLYERVQRMYEILSTMRKDFVVPASEEIETFEHDLHSLPSECHDWPEVQRIWAVLKSWKQQRESVFQTRQALLQGDLSVLDRHLDDVPPPWQQLFRALAVFRQARKAEQQGAFDNAITSYINVLQHFAELERQGFRDPVMEPYRAWAQGALRRLLRQTPDERWEALWEQWRRRIRGCITSLQYPLTLRTRQRLLELQDELLVLYEHAPKHLQTRWEHLIRQIREALKHGEGDDLGRILDDLNEYVQHLRTLLEENDSSLPRAATNTSRALEYVAHIQSTLQHLAEQYPLPLFTTEMAAQQQALLAQLERQLLELEDILQSIVACFEGKKNISELQTQIKKFFALLDALSVAASEQNVISTDRALAKRITWMKNLADILQSPEMLIEAHGSSIARKQLCRRLRALQDNPYAEMLIQSFDSCHLPRRSWVHRLLHIWPRSKSHKA